MIKATIKATGETQYYFESASQPGHYHQATIAGCNCKGYTHHGHCWHFEKVSALTKAARLEAFRTVAAWLAGVERSAAIQAWNDAAVAQTEAALAARPLAGYSIQHVANYVASRALMTPAERRETAYLATDEREFSIYKSGGR